VGYLLKAVQSIVGDQVNTNSEAARRGVVEDWLAYKYFVGWLDGADYILQAIEEAERRAGLASDNDSGFQW
jgi:hypothetical protein